MCAMDADERGYLHPQSRFKENMYNERFRALYEGWEGLFHLFCAEFTGIDRHLHTVRRTLEPLASLNAPVANTTMCAALFLNDEMKL